MKHYKLNCRFQDCPEHLDLIVPQDADLEAAALEQGWMHRPYEDEIAKGILIVCPRHAGIRYKYQTTGIVEY